MKIFKKFNSKTDKIFVGGCTHYFHQREFIFRPRGFNSWQEHTDFLLKELYKLPADSTFIFLGDFALNTNKEQIQSVLNTVKCQIIYILGNHEGAINQIVQGQKELQYGITDKFTDVWPIKYNTTTFLGYCGAIAVDNQYVYLQHMAQYIWPYQSDGSWCCVSHSHSNSKELNPFEQNFGKILDCGTDNALKYSNNQSPFFTWEGIKQIMGRKSVRIYDHHGEKQNS